MGWGQRLFPPEKMQGCPLPPFCCGEATGSGSSAGSCRATLQVRFPSTHNDSGNIYTAARAHLIFMGWLFIDGERLAEAPLKVIL